MRARASLLLKVSLLLVGVALFAALIWQAGPADIWAQVRALGWGFTLFLVPYVIICTIDAWAWRFCLKDPRRVPFWDLWRVRAAGESLNATLPAASMGGEPVKALLLKRFGVNGADGLASVVVGKTAMTVAQILYVVSGLAAAAIVAEGENLPVVLLATSVAVAFATLSIYLAYKAQTYGLGKLLGRVVARIGFGRAFYERRRAGFERLDATLTEFYARDQRRFWIATAMFFLAWVLEAVEVGIFVWLLGLDVGPLEIYAIASLATVAKAAGFFIPASLGAQEGGNVLLFLAFGLTTVTALTFSVVRRVRELLWIGIGLALLAWLGLPAKSETVEPSLAGEPAAEAGAEASA